MNREIKFRGKRIDNGEWVKGFYYEWRSKKIAGKYTAWIHAIEYDENGKKIKDEQYEVIPATVGQYTGMKDMNGVEIYEGDVVNKIEIDEDSCLGNTFETICSIGYGHGTSRYVSQYPASFCLINKDFYLEQAIIHYGDFFEVIGNIQDNPELVEEK